jgi:hypothetical protein
MNQQIEDFREALSQYKTLMEERMRIDFYSIPSNYDLPRPFERDAGDAELQSFTVLRSRDWTNVGKIRECRTNLAKLIVPIKSLADKFHMSHNFKSEYSAVLVIMRPKNDVPRPSEALEQIHLANYLLDSLEGEISAVHVPASPQILQELATVTDAAEAFGLNAGSISRLADSGKIKSTGHKRNRRVVVASVKDYVLKNKNRGKGKSEATIQAEIDAEKGRPPRR